MDDVASEVRTSLELANFEQDINFYERLTDSLTAELFNARNMVEDLKSDINTFKEQNEDLMSRIDTIKEDLLESEMERAALITEMYGSDGSDSIFSNGKHFFSILPKLTRCLLN